MASTFTNLNYHFIFSTKDREPLLAREWRQRLFDYIGGALRAMNAETRGIGGMADHIHLLATLKPAICVSDFMRDLKKATSRWITGTIGLKAFRWQEGYGAFTVSASAIPDVRRYIEDQELHHRKKSFREELLTMLVKSGVAFDERYLD